MAARSSTFLGSRESHEIKHALRRIRAKADAEIAGGCSGGSFAPRKGRFFIGCESCFSVVWVSKNGFRQLRTIKHGESRMFPSHAQEGVLA